MASQHSNRDRVPTLTLVGGYAVVATAVLLLFEGLPTAVRIPLVVPLLLVVPGYAVVTALFPSTRTEPGALVGEDAPSWQRDDLALSPGERAVLAVVASVAVVPIVALAVSFFFGVVVRPILVGVALLTVAAAAVAGLRAPTDDPRQPTAGETYRNVVYGFAASTRSLLTSDRATQVALALALGLVVASAAVAVGGGGDDAGPGVEFYLADETGSAAGTTGSGGAETFDLRVAQHGSGERRYTAIVALHPSSETSARPSAGDLVVLERVPMTVAPEETAGRTVRVDRSRLTLPGTVYFLLYHGDAPAEPAPASAHRTLRLSVNSTAG